MKFPLDFYDIVQNEEEWKLKRGGRITGSNLGKVMANYGKSFGNPARQYAVNIAIEQITGEPIIDQWSNEHMDRGKEQEPQARQLYEQRTFTTVKNGGFFCDELLGDSPDGLIDDNGVFEIKSVIPSVHYDNVRRQSFDPSYKWQYGAHLLFTGREWLDTVSYCPVFPEEKQLYIYRIHADDFQEEFKMIQIRIRQFLEVIEETKQNILNNEYFIQ